MNFCAWTISLALISVAIFGFYPFYQTTDVRSTALEYGFYDGFSHVIWSMPFCYIIFACAHESGGGINWLLSHPIWQPISKLSYATYLVHYPISFLTTASIKTLPYFNEITFIQSVIGNIGLSMLVAIPATLAIDWPIDATVKLIVDAIEQRIKVAAAPPQMIYPMATQKPRVRFVA